jgi:hypothetical protein
MNPNEIWRLIPPEEKFDMLAFTHSKGFIAACSVFTIFSTIAIGLRIQYLIWLSLIISPIIFQYAASIAWKKIKPRVMLEYLAARSAARRYAFAANGRELGLSLIFRGTLYKNLISIDPFSPEKDNFSEDEQSSVSDLIEIAVWIALFDDSVVIMRESKGGAMLEFAHLIDGKLSFKGNFEETSAKGIDKTKSREISQDKSVTITAIDKRTGLEQEMKLKSKYKGALYAFYKKLLQNQKARLTSHQDIQSLAETMSSKSDDYLFSSDSDNFSSNFNF